MGGRLTKPNPPNLASIMTSRVVSGQNENLVEPKTPTNEIMRKMTAWDSRIKINWK